jgi:hypothetical protein
MLVASIDLHQPALSLTTDAVDPVMPTKIGIQDFAARRGTKSGVP